MKNSKSVIVIENIKMIAIILWSSFVLFIFLIIVTIVGFRIWIREEFKDSPIMNVKSDMIDIESMEFMEDLDVRNGRSMASNG